MKVVAFNGSPHKEGNTAIALNKVLDELKAEGIETELIQIGGKPLHGCLACYKCMEKKDRTCHGPKDAMNEYIAKVDEADGLLIGSPTYFASCSTEVKALIDRLGFVSIANDRMLSRKVGAAVIAVRRQGAIQVFNQINMLFFINNMIVPGSTYWNLAVGLLPGDVLKDEEGMQTMVNLGKNMAWLMKKLYA
ncbi:MAG TPA: flavodoxin family protein [Thermodesulfobacteriota bacterium]|nr:flavodoxin family protein [Thermodesulfobacteriota bacterium]